MLYLNAFFQISGVQDYTLAIIGFIFVCEIVYIIIDRLIE